jgi:hypothetical protein
MDSKVVRKIAIRILVEGVRTYAPHLLGSILGPVVAIIVAVLTGHRDPSAAEPENDVHDPSPMSGDG